MHLKNLPVKRLIAAAVILWLAIAIPFPREGGGIIAAILIFGSLAILIAMPLLAIRWLWRRYRDRHA